MSLASKRIELRSPEELLAIGFSRSRVVMMNEAHNGMQRCVRTREMGLRLLPAAHAAGARHLAMEALYGPYLAQPDMQRLIEAAEGLGWRLIPYEVTSMMTTNEREEGQARNLADAVAQLPKETQLLVWCGNSHLSKQPHDWWRPMGYQFWEISGIEPFSIDQTVTVEFGPDTTGAWHQLGRNQTWRLEALGGTPASSSPILRFLARGSTPFCSRLETASNRVEIGAGSRLRRRLTPASDGGVHRGDGGGARGARAR